MRKRKTILSCIFYIALFYGASLQGSFAQNLQNISGVVYDSLSQEPLIGVNILISRTGQGTTTDFNGAFSIQAEDSDVLTFSYIGYKTREMPVAYGIPKRIAMLTDAQTLEELVVTGYSTERKKDITGSVSIVDMETAKSLPTHSAMQALQGQAAGVNVITSGVPGASSNVFIRGISSFGNSSPLVLIDGVEGSLNDISSNDISSIQVLKDAGAAAIYGVRGSNGVIIVTTKKGKSGSPVVTYDAYMGYQLPLPGNPFDILNSEDYAKIVLKADPNNPIFANGIPDYLYAGPGVSGVGKSGDPVVDPSKYVLDPINTANNYLIQKVNKTGTNWFQELFDPALMMNHSLGVSGGTDHSQYLVSLDYLNQQGTLLETYTKRYSLRVNTSFDVGKYLTIGQNANIYYKDSPGFNHQSEFGILSAVYKMMPIIPVYDIMGNYGGTFAGPGLGSNQNPVALQKRTLNDRSNSWNTIGNIYAEADFFKNFTFRTSFGGNINNGYSQLFNFTQYENKQGNSSPNSYSERSNYGTQYVWTNTLNYSSTIKSHSVRALLGSEYIAINGRNLVGSSQQFFSTNYNYLILSNGTSGLSASSSAYEEKLFSVFSRLDYQYQDKYLISATVRRDGSSRFGSNSRFGVFPSFSVGWRLGQEAFMQSMDWLNDLKLRGSYGVLGSQNNVGSNNAFTLFGGGYGNAYYDISGTSNSVTQGFIQTRIGNPNTSWEENIVSNFGVDASIFNYAFDISLEYYKKSINGLLFTQPLPALVGGAAAPVVNIGDIQNQGFDASITYNKNLSKDFRLSLGVNATTYKNEVVSIPDPGYFNVASLQGLGSIVRNQEGEAVSSFFGYEVIGLFNSQSEVENAPNQPGAAPGRFQYKDINNDGVITPDDRTIIGNPNPDLTYGLNTSFKFKNWDASAVFYGSQGNEIVNTIKSYLHFYGGYIGAKGNALLNAWTPENTNTTVPKIEPGTSFSTSGTLNSYFVENGSFLKMKSLLVGYNFDLKSISMNKFRIYLQSTNLFTLTKYSGLDPELGGSSSAFGIDYGNYPNNQRSFILGVNLSF